MCELFQGLNNVYLACIMGEITEIVALHASNIETILNTISSLRKFWSTKCVIIPTERKNLFYQENDKCGSCM